MQPSCNEPCERMCCGDGYELGPGRCDASSPRCAAGAHVPCCGHCSARRVRTIGWLRPKISYRAAQRPTTGSSAACTASGGAANEARPLTARAALEQSSVPSFVIQCPQVPKHRSFEIGLPSSRALLAHAGQV